MNHRCLAEHVRLVQTLDSWCSNARSTAREARSNVSRKQAPASLSSLSKAAPPAFYPATPKDTYLNGVPAMAAVQLHVRARSAL